VLCGCPWRVVVQTRLGREQTHGRATERLFVLATLHRIDTGRAAASVACGAHVGRQFWTQLLEGQELGVVVPAAQQRDGRQYSGSKHARARVLIEARPQRRERRTEASERDNSALK